MDNNKIIESIKNMCKNNNITVTKLEETLGMSQGLIGRWTKSDPSLSKIVDIAEYFHVSLDDVVGFSNNINDKFLEKLIERTVNNTIMWKKYNIEKNTPSDQRLDLPIYKKTFLNHDDKTEYFETHKQTAYISKIKDASILIYGDYKNQNILSPLDIELFIKPCMFSDFIKQSYDYEQLKILWLKVLYALGINSPDEIKAEEFKNSFINDFKGNKFMTIYISED